MDGTIKRKSFILLLFAALITLFIPENVYKDFNLFYFLNILNFNFSSVNNSQTVILFNLPFFIIFTVLIFYFINLFNKKKLFVLYLISLILVIINLFISIYMNFKIKESTGYGDTCYLYSSGLVYNPSFIAYSLFIIMFLVLLIIEERKKINLKKGLNVILIVTFFLFFVLSIFEVKYNGAGEDLTTNFRFNIYLLMVSLLLVINFFIDRLNKRVLDIIFLIISIILIMAYLIISIITIKDGFFCVEYSKFNIGLAIFALSYFLLSLLMDIINKNKNKGENYDEIK